MFIVQECFVLKQYCCGVSCVRVVFLYEMMRLELILLEYLIINKYRQTYYNILLPTMQPNICQQHQKELNIYDLVLNESICQRCAIFQQPYKHHNFIQHSSLPHYCSAIFQQIYNNLLRLNINHQYNEENHFSMISGLCSSKMNEEMLKVNQDYDDKIAFLNKQRDFKLQEMKEKIYSLQKEATSSLKKMVQQQMSQLIKISPQFKDLYLKKDYSKWLRHIKQYNVEDKIQFIQKQFELAVLDLKIRLDHFNKKEFNVPLNKKASQQEQILLNNIEIQLNCPAFVTNQQNYSDKSICKTQISFGCFDSLEENIGKEKSLRNSRMSIDNKQNELKINCKNAIKGVLLKNSTRCVDMSGLSMINRQAIASIKRLTNNTFVSTIDLSNNKITQGFLSQLKRQKIQSKYLKTVILKGMKIDYKQLKKQGINIQEIRTGKGKLKIGEITIIY